MTSMTDELGVLKTDARGRVRVPLERREALMDEFEKSGLSGAAFARLVGIKYATFANWTEQRRKARAPGCNTAEMSGMAGSAISHDLASPASASTPTSMVGIRAS